MRPRLLFLLICCIVCVVSCRSGSDRLLELDSMKVVMWDMMKIDEFFTRMVIKDSSVLNKKDNIRLYEEVFALHHTTREQFRNTYKFYESHPVQFKTLLDSVEAYAQRERNKPGTTPGVN